MLDLQMKPERLQNCWEVKKGERNRPQKSSQLFYLEQTNKSEIWIASETQNINSLRKSSSFV